MSSKIAVLLTLAVAVPVTWYAATHFNLARPHSASGGSNALSSAKLDPSQRRLLYFQSAMHPWIKSDKPGRCTICGMELTPVYEGDAGFDLSGGGEVVPLTQSMIQVLRVQTTEVRVQALQRTLTVAGTIEENAARHRVLAAYVPGRIEKLHVNFLGAEVAAGQPLADFYSPALLQAEREYRTLSGELRAATALRLRQMGLSASQIEALATKSDQELTSQILAPIGGTVVEQRVYEGQYVQEGEKLLEIADLSSLWFQFRAYEQDLPWIQAGLTVAVSTPSQPGRVFPGRISFLEPTFDESTRSTKVRVELANPLEEGRRVWFFGQFAEGRVQLAAPEVLSVPRSAIIETGPEAVAYVDQGGGAYARRALKLGRRGDSLIEVLSGLIAGDRVVVNGNLLIDGQAEMNRSFADPGGMPMATNAAPARLPALSDNQRRAAKEFLELANAVTAALAADRLDDFNTHAAKLHTGLPRLMDGFVGADPAWHNLLKAIDQTAHLEKATDLKAARKSFHPFSTAAVALAQALRRNEKEFTQVKVFRCPMTKDAFPGAPNRAEWLQLQPSVHNPYFGAEMLDCGAEVKP